MGLVLHPLAGEVSITTLHSGDKMAWKSHTSEPLLCSVFVVWTVVHSDFCFFISVQQLESMMLDEVGSGMAFPRPRALK